MDDPHKQIALEKAIMKVFSISKELTKRVPTPEENGVAVFLARISEAVTKLEEIEKELLPANR